jgi:hypothetical protein
LPWFPEPTFCLPGIYAGRTVPLRNAALPTIDAVADPPQLPTEDADSLRTQSVYNKGNLGASPSEFAIIVSKCIMFEGRWEHQCSLRV